MRCWVRHGIGEDGSGVGAGLGTSVSLTVADKTKSYDATYTICNFINLSHAVDIILIAVNTWQGWNDGNTFPNILPGNYS